MKIAFLFLFLAACAAPPKAVEPSEIKTDPKGNVCPGTVMVGWASEEAMTPVDQLCFERAKARCPQLYPKSPCLKKFERRAPETYWAICGEIR